MRLKNVVNDRIIVGWQIGKNLEGSGCGLIETVSLDLPGGTKENHISQSG